MHTKLYRVAFCAFYSLKTAINQIATETNAYNSPIGVT